MEFARTTLVAVVVIAANWAECGQNGDPARVVESPKTGFAAMSSTDKAYFACCFTTLSTVPYGCCMPESLFKNLQAGHKIKEGERFFVFNAPKGGMKQSAGFPEWMRVESLVVEVATRRVVAARGCAGPFANDTAIQTYLDSEMRTDLNSQIFIVKNETTEGYNSMRFVCASKYGSNYKLSIVLREDSSHMLWIDTLATVE